MNQLEYAAVLLQNSNLDVNATVYRYNVYVVYHMTCITGYICRVSYAKVNGTKYSIGCVVLYAFYNDD